MFRMVDGPNFKYTLVFLLSWLPVYCRGQPCNLTVQFECELKLLNMTSDGLARLRYLLKQHTNEVVPPTITVNKIIVAESLSGVFIQRIGDYTESLYYSTYKESVFRFPAGSSIVEMYISNANYLRSFIAGPGTALHSLGIGRSQLERWPETIGMLSRLRELSITDSKLTTVDIASFAANTQLRVVNLRNNHIDRIVRQAIDSPLELAIESVSLATNRIVLLDMAVYASMPLLREILMPENRIQRIGTSEPFTAHNLTTLVLSGNQITQLNLTDLTLPMLEYLTLDDNAIDTIPSDWTNVPSLRVLSLERNHLKQLDMSALRQLQSLDVLYLGGNYIEQVWTSAPVKLANLRTIHLVQNRIRVVNLRGCQLPQINSMFLMDNPISTVPSVFKLFPRLHVSLDSTKIRCRVLLPYRGLMIEGRLFTEYVEENSTCATDSYVQVDDLKACCLA
uniref:Leucine rich immune protein (Coil-less) n=1 Tax=Anopheles farauti TaxID=69004 RepID=A0A182Q2F0_9DIPT